MRLDPHHVHLRQAWSPSSRVRAEDLFSFVQRARELLGPETTASVWVTDNRTFEIRAAGLDDLQNVDRPRKNAGHLTAEVVIEAPMGDVRIDIGARRGLGRFFTKATARHAEKLVAEELMELGSDPSSSAGTRTCAPFGRSRWDSARSFWSSNLRASC